MSTGSILEIEHGATLQRLSPDPEIVAIAAEVQRQNAAIIEQNALILKSVLMVAAFITRPETSDFVPQP